MLATSKWPERLFLLLAAVGAAGAGVSIFRGETDNALVSGGVCAFWLVLALIGRGQRRIAQFERDYPGWQSHSDR